MRRLFALLLVALPAIPCSAPFASIAGGRCRAFITTTGAGTLVIPSDWTAVNELEAIGGGGAGISGSSGGAGGTGGNGGSGAAYSKITNQTLSGTLGIFVAPVQDINGFATYLCSDNSANCSVAANPTANGSAVILLACTSALNTGGVASGHCNGVGVSVGSAFKGGDRGTGGSGHAGGGGGGAGGPSGAGVNGSSTTGAGGTGDTTVTPANTNGTEWSTSPAYGSGGGGDGAPTAGVGTAGGTYGAGGGGGRAAGNAGGAGQSGILVVTYTPAASGIPNKIYTVMQAINRASYWCLNVLNIFAFTRIVRKFIACRSLLRSLTIGDVLNILAGIILPAPVVLGMKGYRLWRELEEGTQTERLSSLSRRSSELLRLASLVLPRSQRH